MINLVPSMQRASKPFAREIPGKYATSAPSQFGAFIYGTMMLSHARLRFSRKRSNHVYIHRNAV